MAENLRLSHSYFSALARGGLTAALNFNNVSSNSPSSKSHSQQNSSHKSSMIQSPKQHQQLQEITNSGFSNQKSGKGSQNNSRSKARDKRKNKNSHDENYYHGGSHKRQKQLPPAPQQQHDPKQMQQQSNSNKEYRDQHLRKLQSLMSGNDLQPLEEEVSKEEDDSICHYLMQQTSHGMTQTTSRQSQFNQQDEQMIIAQPSQLSFQHRLMQNSSSSYISGDFNYNMNMEEAQARQIIVMCNYDAGVNEDENVAPKIFDPQFQQSFQTAGNQSLGTVGNNSTMQNFKQSKEKITESNFDQAQKNKAKQIIESLKAQQSQAPKSYAPIAQRLFDYQRKIEEKHEIQRKEKELEELKSLRPIPQISDKTNEILLRKSMQLVSSNNQTTLQGSNQKPRSESHSPSSRQCMFSNSHNSNIMNGTQVHSFQNYLVEPKSYYEELKRREELRQQMLKEKEMQGFTGKPEINKKSRSMKRKIDDLIEWKEYQQKKKEGEQQKKLQLEQEQMHQLQSHRAVNKQSERLIQYKTKQNREKVEDRLMREANHRQKKLQNQIFSISDLGKTSKSLGNQKRVRSKSAQQKSKEPSPYKPNVNDKLSMVIRNQCNLLNSSSPLLSDNSGQVIKQSVLSPLSVSHNSENYSFQNQKQQFIQHHLNPQPHQVIQPAQPQTMYPLQQIQNFPYMINPYQMTQVDLYQPSSMNIQQQFQPQPQRDPSSPPLYNESYYNLQQEQKHLQSIKPQQPPAQKNSANQSSQPKKKTGYESLFEKLQRMNTSSNNISGSVDHESSRSSQMPIISAVNPHNYQQQRMAFQTQISSPSHSDNPIYQSIQEDSKRLTQQQQQLMTLQYPLASEQQWFSTHDSNGFMFMTQGNSLLSQQQHYFNQMDSAEKKMLLMPMSSRNLNFNQLLLANATSQEQIIHKILENSFIPSGNVNQPRRISSKAIEEQSSGGGGGGGTFGATNPCFSSGEENPDEMALPSDYDNCFSNHKLQFEFESCFNSNENRTRNQQEQCQILETEFITNTSRTSDLNVVRNLNQVLQQEDLHQKKSQGQNSISSPRNQDESKPLSFMDRNNHWLEKKKHKIEKAREISEKRQERECPFKPQLIHLNAEKQSQGNKSSRSKSSHHSLESKQCHNQSQSSQNETSKSKSQVEKETQVNVQAVDSPTRNSLISVNRTNVPITVKDLSVQTSDRKTMYNAFQGLSSNSKSNAIQVFSEENISSINPVSQVSSSNYDSLPKSGIFKKENQQIMVLHELEMSEQCDISNLSPDKGNFNDDESMMSLGAGEIDTHEKQQMGSHAFVKTINKKAIHF